MVFEGKGSWLRFIKVSEKHHQQLLLKVEIMT